MGIPSNVNVISTTSRLSRYGYIEAHHICVQTRQLRRCQSRRGSIVRQRLNFLSATRYSRPKVGICDVFLSPTRKTCVTAPCLPDDLIDVNILGQLTGHRIHWLGNVLSNEKACQVRSLDLSFRGLLTIPQQQGVQGTYRTYEVWQGLEDRLCIPDIVTFSSPQQLNSIIPKQPHLSHFATRCPGCPEPQSIDGSTADVLSGVLALPPTSSCLVCCLLDCDV
ncbi:hypothetical protein F5141DRAFT_256548 [Pisolithus sp. B1]|nr:hypothetical protein F5141DRAFT_256548 [Pisolithus sp. B1]